MSKLSIEDVEHIASLSKLELSDSEKEKFRKQLSSVIGYVEELNEVDTNNIEEMSQVTGLVNIVSEDKVEAGKMNYKNIDENAPEFKDGNFVVPGIFDN